LQTFEFESIILSSKKLRKKIPKSWAASFRLSNYQERVVNNFYQLIMFHNANLYNYNGKKLS